MSLLKIDEPAAPATHLPWRGAHPVWALGFRPFYLLAAALAALAVPLWVAQYLGWLQWGQLGLAWHMHELVFGMAVAVIVGFLFTAGRHDRRRDDSARTRRRPPVSYCRGRYRGRSRRGSGGSSPAGSARCAA